MYIRYYSTTVPLPPEHTATSKSPKVGAARRSLLGQRVVGVALKTNLWFTKML
jgi:hypothetical protein